MGLLLETVTENRELSQYEMERNKPMPSLNHAVVQTNLLVSTNYRYQKNYTILSEIDLIMPEKPNTVPDIAIYPKLKIDFFDDQIGMAQMPLTAIEIVSPSQTDSELIKKINRYFNAGVKSCWLVNPAFQAVYVYSAIGKYQFFNTGMTLSDPATGIEIPLSEVFAE